MNRPAVFAVVQTERMTESGTQRVHGSESVAMKLAWMRKGNQAKAFNAYRIQQCRWVLGYVMQLKGHYMELPVFCCTP